MTHCADRRITCIGEGMSCLEVGVTLVVLAFVGLLILELLVRTIAVTTLIEVLVLAAILIFGVRWILAARRR